MRRPAMLGNANFINLSIRVSGFDLIEERIPFTFSSIWWKTPTSSSVLLLKVCPVFPIHPLSHELESKVGRQSGVKIVCMEAANTASDKKVSDGGYIVLLRHGQTVWSETGQYTGRTDIPLTVAGEKQAKAAGDRLSRQFPRGFDKGCLFCSPLLRARQTAQLAGFADATDMPDIQEWDYGPAEGHRLADVVKEVGWDWKLWNDGPQALRGGHFTDWDADLPSGDRVRVHVTQGETLGEAVNRTQEVIRRIEPLVRSGKHILLVAHAHILRILVTQWLDIEPQKAQLLRMDTAHYGVLGLYQGQRVLKQWNV